MLRTGTALGLIIVLVCASSGVVFASEAKTLEQRKAERLAQIEANLKKDGDLKSCIQKAQNPAEISVCEGKQAPSRNTAGPNFANNKDKHLKAVDKNIKIREDRKGCIQKAQNLAEFNLCNKIK